MRDNGTNINNYTTPREGPNPPHITHLSLLKCLVVLKTSFNNYSHYQLVITCITILCFVIQDINELYKHIDLLNLFL